MGNIANIPILRVRDNEGKIIDIPAIKGDPGKDYVLTEADKAEIAEQAAALIDASLLSVLGDGVIE
jgi:hypothetical protein